LTKMLAVRTAIPACLALAIGCVAPSSRTGTPPPAAYPYPYPYPSPYGATSPVPPAATSVVALNAAPLPPVGSPLPAGWAWPVNAQAIALGLSEEIYRPINVQALMAAANAGPCAPVEVAPSVWITPFCGKLPDLSFSPRAGAPPVAATTPTPTASGVDLRTLGLDGPVKDQQQAAVCWSFALSTVMDNALRRVGRAETLAPLHIIADDEFQLLLRKGSGRLLVLEKSWPYDPHKACRLDDNSIDRSYCSQAYSIPVGSWKSDPALVAERERAEAAGLYRILAFHPLKHRPADPEEMARVLGTGQAVFVELDINTRSWSSAKHQPGAVLADWQPDGSGGHAVALVGYRPSTTGAGRQFLVHNSWGKGWGEGGYAWVNETMVRDRINQAFVVTVGDSRGALSAPSTTPAPTPGPNAPTTGCPANNVRGSTSRSVCRPVRGRGRPHPRRKHLSEALGPAAEADVVRRRIAT